MIYPSEQRFALQISRRAHEGVADLRTAGDRGHFNLRPGGIIFREVTPRKNTSLESVFRVQGRSSTSITSTVQRNLSDNSHERSRSMRVRLRASPFPLDR